MVQNSTSSYITLSDDEDDMKTIPKTEMVQDLPSGNMYLHQIGDNGASSSGTNLRSSFIGMGFSPVLIDKAIKEKGEGDIDLLMETLIELSTRQQSYSESSSVNATVNLSKGNTALPGGCSVSRTEKDLSVSESTSLDSLDSLFDDEKGEEIHQGKASVPPKEEPIFLSGMDSGIRASLLGMKFSVKEVEFAIDKLGEDAPIYEIVDFITAAQMAESEDNDMNLDSNEKNEENDPETLYGTVDRTLRLLEMGFSDHDVSSAIESFDPEVPVTELADWICAGRPARPSCGSVEGISGLYPEIKTEEGCPDIDHQTPAGEMTLEALFGGKLPKEEYDELGPSVREFDLDDIKGKRVKEEYDDSFSAVRISHPLKKSKTLNSAFSNQESSTKFNVPGMSAPYPSRNLDKMLAAPPFFLYGNVVNLSSDSWNKMSQFLYALEPEFANCQFFSAISRREGYLHNLPTDERSVVEENSPMTIEDAMPHTKKWWPQWDPRKQISCISTETVGVTQICDSLKKMLVDSKGVLSPEQQTKILYYCRSLNLVWIGKYKLGPIEPEYLEKILGYPVHHTNCPEIRLPEQLELLRTCFQTDTLAYYLSPLKCFFPDGITVLSVYDGIGGAEVALHRLGIRLRGVVSVETSEVKRRILKRWWETSGQTGELVQLEDVQKLSSNKLDFYMKKFGGFDLVVGQNPCTYTPRTTKAMGKSGDVVGLDFSLYCEFVRVLQRIRGIMEHR